MAVSPMQDLKFVFGEHEPGLTEEQIALMSNVKFVRGNHEISVYEAERNPTGHVLTAWEAYTTFGLDVLEEAVEWGGGIILSERKAIETSLRNRRTDLGLSAQSVAQAADVSPADVEQAEKKAWDVPIQVLERIAFALGLDESRLAYHPTAVADDGFAARLKNLQSETPYTPDEVHLSEDSALKIAEATSVVRVQSRLQELLGMRSLAAEFEPDANYGSSRSNPAWKVGYSLAEKARARLGLEATPIASMRALVEDELGVPVIQTSMQENIAGVTVAVTGTDGRERRGIVLNINGQNRDMWIRRATLAHGIGHLLYDPEDRLEKARVDSYAANDRNPESPSWDYVEQRANAFAIAFLAPLDAVRKMSNPLVNPPIAAENISAFLVPLDAVRKMSNPPVNPPIAAENIARVMRTFGISHIPANFHAVNANYGEYAAPTTHISGANPTDEQKEAEDFAAKDFPIPSAPIQRRGKFAGIVAEAYMQRYISEQTAAAYLNCDVSEFLSNAESLPEIYRNRP